MFSRLLVIFPLLLATALIDLDLEYFKVFVSAGFYTYMIIGLVFFYIVLIGLESLYSKILKYKITGNMSIYFRHLVVPFYLTWSFIPAMLFYQVIAGEVLRYGIWSIGVSNVNILTSRGHSRHMSKIGETMNASIDIAREELSEEALAYTLKKNNQFLTIKECIAESSKLWD